MFLHIRLQPNFEWLWHHQHEMIRAVLLYCKSSSDYHIEIKIAIRFNYSDRSRVSPLLEGSYYPLISLLLTLGAPVIDPIGNVAFMISQKIHFFQIT